MYTAFLFRSQRYFKIQARLFLAVTAVLFASSCFAAKPAIAAEAFPSKPKNFTIEKQKKYNPADLAADFLRTAYPRHLWINVSPFRHVRSGSKIFVPGKEEINVSFKSIPWALEYIQRTEGRPRFDGLSKWKQQEIGIAYRWPPVEDKYLNDIDEKSYEIYQDIIIPHINKIKDDIAAAVGIPLKVMERNDETVEHYGDIRFILIDGMTHRNHFKAVPSEFPGFIHFGFSIGEFQEHLSDAIRFTAMARAQVEGYFLTDKDNNIGLAVCILNTQLPRDLLESLTTECLVRAMGLPEMADLHQDSVLGHWNKIYDPYSERYLLDGPTTHKDVSTGSNPDGSIPLPRREQVPLPQEINITQYPTDGEERIIQSLFPGRNFSLRPTAYDLNMLKILYCPELKAGMTQYQVQDALLSGETSCFANLEGKP
tara:strand:+ start:160 stop:1437 length:1278 start_codon:yes stop_codon:yes gene_type:complete